MKSNKILPLVAVTLGLAASVAQTAQSADLFGISEVSPNGQLIAEHEAGHKCGGDKCGSDKGEHKCGSDKCGKDKGHDHDGDHKCGSDKGHDDHKCGSDKCGSDK